MKQNIPEVRTDLNAILFLQIVFQAHPKRISCGLIGFKKHSVTTKLQDEDGSSPRLGVTPLGGSRPSGQWATGLDEASGPGPSCRYLETWARGEGRAGSGEAQHQHAPPPLATSHVHGAHGNQRHLQVHQHRGVLPGVRRGDHREFHSAENHL